MAQKNTPSQIQFFHAIRMRDVARLRTLVATAPDLLDCYDYQSFGATPLTAACFGGQMESVEALIELGADPNKRSDWHMGPWSPLHCAIYKRDRTLAEFLLSHGAVMDVHTAAGLGKVQEIQTMLDGDPSRVHEPGGDGCQPLHFADSIAVAELLLVRGADIDARCIDHHSTPAQYLCSARPEVARYLLSRGATPDVFTTLMCGDLGRLEQLISAEPALVHARVNQSSYPPGAEHNVHNILTFVIGQDATLLHAASMSDQDMAVDLLVAHGLSPNVRGAYDSGTPLHTAAWHDRSSAASKLLSHGADLESRSGRLHNNTPAGWAIVAGSEGVFKLLMERGAARHPWFIDDARDACAGRFDAVSRAPREQRERILAWLMERP